MSGGSVRRALTMAVVVAAWVPLVVETPLGLASLLLTYITTAVAWAFIALYHVLTRGAWRHDQMGRHLMSLAGVDAGIFTMLSIATLWPQLAVQEWFQRSYLGTVSGIAAVTAWRAVILWRLHRPMSGEHR